MKLMLFILLMVPNLVLAAPSHLKCSDDIEIDFQNNWLFASYIGVDNGDDVDWYDWTGGEPLVDVVDLDGSTPLLQIPNNTFFTRFERTAGENHVSVLAPSASSRLFIETGLLGNSPKGKVLLQEPSEENNKRLRVLDCVAP